MNHQSCTKCNGFGHQAEDHCRRCDSSAHNTEAHKVFYDDTAEQRLRYLEGWETARLGSRFPKDARDSERFQDGFLAGRKAA